MIHPFQYFQIAIDRWRWDTLVEEQWFPVVTAHLTQLPEEAQVQLQLFLIKSFPT